MLQFTGGVQTQKKRKILKELGITNFLEKWATQLFTHHSSSETFFPHSYTGLFTFLGPEQARGHHTGKNLILSFWDNDSSIFLKGDNTIHINEQPFNNIHNVMQLQFSMKQSFKSNLSTLDLNTAGPYCCQHPTPLPALSLAPNSNICSRRLY